MRLGVDLVRVQDIRDSISRFGQRYLDRLFTVQEQRDVAEGSPPDQALRLAARFAAKEATLKVLRPAQSDAIAWTSIEVIRANGGWTELVLHGEAERLARSQSLHGFSVSLSHEPEYAVAVVAGCP